LHHRIDAAEIACGNPRNNPITSWRMLMPWGHNIDSNITRGVNPELDSIFSLSVNHLACFGSGFAADAGNVMAAQQHK
jgi:hypothetical protein